jgi:argininosuccinate lyase
MNSTGRIPKALPIRLQRMVYGDANARQSREMCRMLATLDECQALVLIRARILNPVDARCILRAIETEKAEDFRNVLRHPSPRGGYLAWEDWLAGATKEQLRGALHVGRSRNDLNATIQRLELRECVLSIATAQAQFIEVLLKRAQREKGVVLPAFTHFQPAVPILASQMWLAWATAMERDTCLLLDAMKDLDVLPLGAGAVAGSRIPIDTGFAAKLLGFSRTVDNSIDAVASRTFLLKLLAACTILGTDLSRFATDLLFLATRNAPILRLPDQLLGSSSQMPQKANPFLLELVQSRAMSSLQAFVGAVSKMHATPYTNSFAVSSEAKSGARDSLEQVLESLTILSWVTSAAVFDPEAGYEACQGGFTTATALAEQLTLKRGLQFREAHRIVGEIVRASAGDRETFERLTTILAEDQGVELHPADMDPRQIASICDSGGGTGTRSLQRQLGSQHRRLASIKTRITAMQKRYAGATRLLQEKVSQCLAEAIENNNH